MAKRRRGFLLADVIVSIALLLSCAVLVFGSVYARVHSLRRVAALHEMDSRVADELLLLSENDRFEDRKQDGITTQYIITGQLTINGRVITVARLAVEDEESGARREYDVLLSEK